MRASVSEIQQNIEKIISISYAVESKNHLSESQSHVLVVVDLKET